MLNRCVAALRTENDAAPGHRTLSHNGLHSAKISKCTGTGIHSDATPAPKRKIGGSMRLRLPNTGQK
jgi:hypothetical protein